MSLRVLLERGKSANFFSLSLFFLSRETKKKADKTLNKSRKKFHQKEEEEDGHPDESERDGFLPEDPAGHDARDVSRVDSFHRRDRAHRLLTDRGNESVRENDLRYESGGGSIGGRGTDADKL